jgi:hypothetical protein
MFTQKNHIFLSLLLFCSTTISANNSHIPNITIPKKIVANIQHDTTAHTTFTALSNTEKQLFLEAIFCLFVGSSLEAMATSLTAHIKVGGLRPAAQLAKVSELQKTIYARKQTCFKTIQTTAPAVIAAIEHVRSNGQAVTAYALTELETHLADYNQKLSTMITIIAHNIVEAQKKLGNPDMQSYGESIPVCVANFDNTMSLCNDLEASCLDLERALIVRLYIANTVIETGLQMLNLYYTAVYQQADNADNVNLPADLVVASRTLLQSINSLQ